MTNELEFILLTCAFVGILRATNTILIGNYFEIKLRWLISYVTCLIVAYYFVYG